MKQLTVRGFDGALERRLRKMADEEQISLNRAALTLMRRGAGLAENEEPDGTIGSSLDSFIGVWTEDDAAELERSLEPFETIDPELWS